MAEINRYGPGREPEVTRHGDFLLTHRNAFPSRMIAFGQRLRFRGRRRRYAHWSHAVIVAGDYGELIEALGGGVLRTNINRYRNVEYHIVHVAMTDTERAHVVAYAQAMADRHERYGWLEIISLGLQLLTGARLALTTDGHMICSGLVSTGLERTAAIFPRNAGCMLPADLAAYYDVCPG